MTTLASLMVRIGADTSGFIKGMEDSQKRIQRMADSMQDMGARLTTGLSLPILGVGGAALKMATDFNESMANVSTLIPESAARIEELKKSVQGMAVATGKSTGDIAGGLYQVISAFGDTAETARVLETNVRAAAAGLATTTDAINLTSAVTKAYGDTSAASIQKVADLAFQTVKLGQTTFPELAASIGRVTPLAASLGVNMESLFGVMATATGVTGNAAEVSTQLRGVLQGLMAPTETMGILMQNLGFQNGQAMIQSLGLSGTIKAIVEAAESTNTPLQSYMGSIEGQTLALALAGAQSATLADKLTAMSNVVGATDEAFKAQTQGVNSTGFAMAQFQQKLIVTAQGLGDTLAPALMSALGAAQPIIAWAEKAVQWFMSLDQGTKTWVVGLTGLVAVLGPILAAAGFMLEGLTALGGLVKVVTAAQWLWNAALSANPIGLVVLAVAGLTAAGIALYKNWDTVKTKILEIWDAITSGIKAAINGIIEAINGMVRAFNSVRVTVPSWVPGVGGKGIGFNMPTIPKLADGGIVNRPTVALIGEAGPEAVVPLNRGGYGATYNISVSVTGNNINKDYDVDRVAERIVRRLRLKGVTV